MTSGMTAELLVENICRFRATTNLYRGSDGRYLLVTVPDPHLEPPDFSGFGSFILSDDPEPVAVFLSTEDGVVIDADGSPSNGMTPIELFYDGVSTHAEALERLGYLVAAPKAS